MTTPNRGYPFSSRANIPAGSDQIEDLAMAVDSDMATQLASIAASIAALDARLDIMEAAYSTYTPTFAASGGGAAVGNGTLAGRYLQIGKTVYVDISFTFGTTSNAGVSGFWTFTLPVTARAVRCGAGAMYILDSGSADRGGLNMYNNTTTTIAAVNDTDVNIGPGVPQVWANGDIFLASFRYEAA